MGLKYFTLRFKGSEFFLAFLRGPKFSPGLFSKFIVSIPKYVSRAFLGKNDSYKKKGDRKKLACNQYFGPASKSR